MFDVLGRNQGKNDNSQQTPLAAPYTTYGSTATTKAYFPPGRVIAMAAVDRPLGDIYEADLKGTQQPPGFMPTPCHVCAQVLSFAHPSGHWADQALTYLCCFCIARPAEAPLPPFPLCLLICATLCLWHGISTVECTHAFSCGREGSHCSRSGNFSCCGPRRW